MMNRVLTYSFIAALGYLLVKQNFKGVQRRFPPRELQLKKMKEFE